MKRMFKKIGVLGFSLGLVLSAGLLEAQQLFYFSTEKTFSLAENKRVKLEASPNLNSLQVRVYQINNPLEFYQKQENFHRPQLGKREFRRYSLEIVDGFYNYVKNSVQHYVREKWPNPNRNNSLAFLPELRGSLEKENIQFSTVIKPLSDSNYRLVKDFHHTVPSNPKSYHWTYSYIFLNDLKEGSYLVEGVDKSHVAYTVLNVSRLGFVLKKSETKVLIYTVNNATGEPLKNVNLTLFDRFNKKKEVWSSGKDGLLYENLKENEFFVAGKTESGSYAFYDPKYYPLASKSARVYIYTDRPVYRGGDEVNFKGIARIYDNGDYELSENQEVFIEIITQRGNVVDTLKTSLSEMGTFNQKFVLPADAQTGRYTIIATINGQKHEAEFKVEYYQKPEFEVKVKMDKPFYVGGERINAEIQADYYYGEAVKNAKVHYSIYRSRFLGDQSTDFLSPQEFQFAQMELLQQGDASLDDKGRVWIKAETKKEKELYLYHIEARVTDASGVGITGKAKAEVVTSMLKISAAADKFLYLLGEKIQLKVLTRDYFNQPLAASLNIKISCQLAVNNTYIFMDEKISTNEKGEKLVNFKAVKTGFVKIMIRGQDKLGNVTVFEKYLWIGEDGAAYFYQGGSVQMVLDKSSYKVGETAKLLLLSPVSDINFLFSLEGDQIYKHQVQKFDKNSAMILIPVTKNFAPNVFASVQFIFQNQIYSNTIQLRIPAVDQILNIQVQPNKSVYKPQEKAQVKIKVKDNQGKAVKNAELSLAVVDEAIYGISPELAVGIHDFYYPLRRNNVKTWNSIGFRFYGYSKNAKDQLADLFKKPTGLGAFKEKDVKERKNFKDTVLWLPAVKTNADGEATVSFSFPDNITRWRMTAVGVTHDTKVGKNIGSAVTKMSVFTQLVSPLYINENDKITLYSVVHNLTDSPVSVNLRASASGLIFAKKEQEILVKAKSTQTVEWEAVASSIGGGTVTIDLRSREYTDKLTKKITVLPHSIQQTKTTSHLLSEADSTAVFDLPKGIYEKSLTLELNLSYGYYSAIAAALPYLIGYPWGCVEQTTSSFLPNLVALKAFQQIGVEMPEAQKKMPDIVSKGLARLYQFQNTKGGWGWFNENEVDIYMTSYVLYALTLSRNLGVSINYSAFNKGIDSLIRHLSSAKTQSEKMFAVYVLALNRRHFPAVLEQIEKDPSLNSFSTAMMAIAYQLGGKKEKAQQALSRLIAKKKEGTYGTVFWAEENTYEWYRDSIEATAWAVRAINLVGYDKELLEKAVSYLMMHREGTQWKSTRDTAAVIFALTDLMGKDRTVADKKYTVVLNGKALGDLNISKKQFQTTIKLPYVQLTGLIKNTGNQVQVSGITGGEKSYLSISQSYATLNRRITENFAGVSVKRNYYELETVKKTDGTMAYKVGKETSSFSKGKEVLVILKISAQKSGNYLMLEDYYPAGCTPVKDFKLYQIQGLKNYHPAPFADYRDEKAAFFVTSLPAPMEIYYILKPVFTGKYKVLPAQGRLMYFPLNSGNSGDHDLIIQ